MKRIFPKERIITGILVLAFILFIFSLFLPSEISFDLNFVLDVIFFTVGFGISFNLIFSHVSYDFENLFSWTIFGRTKIPFNSITKIIRIWEGSGKTVRCNWFVYYYNDYWGREFKSKIQFPEDYESKNIAELVSRIKSVNSDFKFLIEMKKY